MLSNRAYALLEIKAVDTERRIITGMATTPTPDRTGDVLDPLGVSYKNPLPLLLHHDQKSPVGIVVFKAPTKAGIEFEARLPIVEEPPSLKDRVDVAWSSIKAGLIRGVSVGYRTVAQTFNKDTGGYRILKSEVLELSLVTVPANADATIASLKSYDFDRPAALGTGGAASVIRYGPGASGVSTKEPIMYTEQIKGLQATRLAKVDERAALQELATKDGRTKTETEQEQFETLTREISGCDRELKDLELLEAENVKAAKPVHGANPTEAARSRGGDSYITVRRNLEPGQEFAQAILCKVAAFDAFQRGEPRPATEFAKTWYPDNPRIAMYLKAAVAPATTTDPTWAGALVNPVNIEGEFIDFARPKTIIGNPIFSSRVTNVPFNARIIGQTTGGAGYWTGEAKPKPLTKFDFAPKTLGFSKVAAISVISREIARFSTPSAEMLVRNALTKAINARIDIDLIDPAKAAVANVSPASLTNGLTPLASSGTDAASVIADLGTLLGGYLDANQDVANLLLIMPNTLTLAISSMRNAAGARAFPDMGLTGGTVEGIQVIATQYAKHPTAGNLVIAVNASEVLLADDGRVTVDMSREASLEMLDGGFTQAPPTGAVLVSLWQNNLIGLLAEREIAWVKTRADAVSYMDHVDWGAAPAPGLMSAGRETAAQKRAREQEEAEKRAREGR